MPSRRSTRLARAASVVLLSTSGAVALVPTAASAATDAIVTDSGCTTNALAPNDDGSTGAIPLPSPLKFYDRTVTDAFVNNNGNITFDSPMGDFRGHISTLPRPLVAPFFADLDTRGTGVPVTYGDITFGSRPALCVNWHDIGFFNRGTSPTNDFQALLVDRSDLVAGDFDVIFNYGRVGGDYGGAAQIGFSSADGNPDHVYVLPGSGTSGAFLDSNLETGLVNHARDSAVLGRYVFHFRRGLLAEVPPPDTSITTEAEARSNDASPSFTYTTTAPEPDHGRFDCRITLEGQTAGPWTTCPDDGMTYDDLADGTWTFEVRAADVYLNADETPASSTFTIDTVAPESSITAAPAPMVGTDAVTFGFASDADPSTFECRLSAAGQTAAWQSCSGTSKTYFGLADGGHTFDVRATDAAGNTDATPATSKVEVNVGRPTITASIVSRIPISAAGWYRNAVTITYSCAGNGSALIAPCPAPREVPRAQRGRNTFKASIKTADGDTATVSRTLYIDKGRPKAAIKGFSGKKAYTSMPKPRCVASDPRSGLDDCAIRVTKVTQKDGDRWIVVRARATDQAGNVRVVEKRAPFRAG